MTKEECLNAIDVVARYCNEARTGHVPPRFELTNELDILMKVVEEHFDNPPLKFEELEVGMWVWDNKWKTYYTIGKFRNKNIYARYVRFVVDPYTDEQKVDNNGWMGVFEENRFYRKEVKGNAE